MGGFYFDGTLELSIVEYVSFFTEGIIKGNFDNDGFFTQEWTLSAGVKNNATYEYSDIIKFNKGVMYFRLMRNTFTGEVYFKYDNENLVNSFFKNYDKKNNISIVDGKEYSITTKSVPYEVETQFGHVGQAINSINGKDSKSGSGLLTSFVRKGEKETKQIFIRHIIEAKKSEDFKNKKDLALKEIGSYAKFRANYNSPIWRVDGFNYSESKYKETVRRYKLVLEIMAPYPEYYAFLKKDFDFLVSKPEKKNEHEEQLRIEKEKKAEIQRIKEEEEKVTEEKYLQAESLFDKISANDIKIQEEYVVKSLISSYANDKKEYKIRKKSMYNSYRLVYDEYRSNRFWRTMSSRSNRQKLIDFIDSSNTVISVQEKMISLSKSKTKSLEKQLANVTETAVIVSAFKNY